MLLIIIYMTDKNAKRKWEISMVWEALIILLLIIQSEKLFWLLSPHFQLTKISLDKPLPEGNWKLCSTMYWQPQQLHVSICSVQSFSRVWLCNHMDCSTAGLPVHHQLLEFTQTHVLWVSNAILLSHALASPSSPAFNLSQHQALFQEVNSPHQVAKGVEY